MDLKCSIYTKQVDLSFEKCNRFAFTPLNNDHLKQAAKKCYPFYVDNEEKSLFICQAHHKLIQNAPKFNEQTYRINLSQYEVDDRRVMHEFLSEFVEFNTLEDETKNKFLDSLLGQEFQNLHERYRNLENIYETGNGNDPKANAQPRENFEVLSATTLRRYKKFFKLPNRSGATSKIQLLEGVHEHFESIPIDVKEAAANFLLTVHRKSNQLDNPNSE